jgi:ribosome biogenesis protein BRX1
MAKKRKRTDAAAKAAAAEKPDDFAPERSERTLFGFKEPPAPAPDAEPASAVVSPAAAPFRNKEKVLVTCSRRITYR